jgi:hypothetical protein
VKAKKLSPEEEMQAQATFEGEANQILSPGRAVGQTAFVRLAGQMMMGNYGGMGDEQ